MKPFRSHRWLIAKRSSAWRKPRNSAPSEYSRPHLECLEDRRVPSGASFFTAPVIPVIGPAMQANLLAIHAHGQALGNRDSAFSRVGDSISATPSFLTDLGSSWYDLINPALLGDHPELAPTIDYFRSQVVDDAGNNSFTHPSHAAVPGWLSQTLLSGQPVYTPLQVEFASTHPAIALIMIGTNDAIWGVDPAVFRANLMRIAGTAIDMGVIPVLSTIPDDALYSGVFEPRVFVLNQVIADVASDLNVPLWNYWLAAHLLPGYGIQPGGAHPSQSPSGSAIFTDQGLLWGYNMRNFTALEVLGELRTVVLHVSDPAPPIAPAISADVSIAAPSGGITSPPSAGRAPNTATGSAAVAILATQQPAAVNRSTVSSSSAALEIVATQQAAANSTVVSSTPVLISTPSTPATTLSVGVLLKASAQNLDIAQESGGGGIAVIKEIAKDATPAQPKPASKPELLPSPTPAEDVLPDIITVGVPAFDYASASPAPAALMELSLPLVDEPGASDVEILAAGLLGTAAARWTARLQEDDDAKRAFCPAKNSHAASAI